jgi:hypothetical protein
MPAARASFGPEAILVAPESGTSLTQKRVRPFWICRELAETVMKRTPGNLPEPNEIICVISRELNLSAFGLARILSIALRIIFCKSRPNTVARITSAREKKVHPVFWISRSNPYASKSWTSPQPGKQGFVSSRNSLGRSAESLIKIVPVVISRGIGDSSCSFRVLGIIQTHVLHGTCLRQTESSHRIILRVSAMGAMGLYDHEHRRSGNPVLIFVPMGHLVLYRVRPG